jgi:CheY-like chemotaxis protein
MTKVLVVEDEPLLLMLACDIVQDLGFDVLEATNANEAVKLLEEYPEVRILMTDIDMPGSMDGLKLAAAVRERWPPVQIVIVSGKHRPGRRELPEGSVFLPKPYDVGHLSETLVRMAA